MTPETEPRWDDNGDPITIAAAACDALDWLDWLRDHLAAEHRGVDYDQARANLSRCISALRKTITEKITNEKNNQIDQGPEISREEDRGPRRPVLPDGSSSGETLAESSRAT